MFEQQIFNIFDGKNSSRGNSRTNSFNINASANSQKFGTNSQNKLSELKNSSTNAYEQTVSPSTANISISKSAAIVENVIKPGTNISNLSTITPKSKCGTTTTAAVDTITNASGQTSPLGMSSMTHGTNSKTNSPRKQSAEINNACMNMSEVISEEVTATKDISTKKEEDNVTKKEKSNQNPPDVLQMASISAKNGANILISANRPPLSELPPGLGLLNTPTPVPAPLGKSLSGNSYKNLGENSNSNNSAKEASSAPAPAAQPGMEIPPPPQ